MKALAIGKASKPTFSKLTVMVSVRFRVVLNPAHPARNAIRTNTIASFLFIILLLSLVRDYSTKVILIGSVRRPNSIQEHPQEPPNIHGKTSPYCHRSSPSGFRRALPGKYLWPSRSDVCSEFSRHRIWTDP